MRILPTMVTMRLTLIGLWLCLLACLTPSFTSAQVSNISKQTLTKPNLQRGVNISHWFWIPHNPDPQALATFITKSDINLLKAAGITHIRLPLEPSMIWDDSTQSFKPHMLDHLRRAVQDFSASQIAIILDAHPARTPWGEPQHPEFSAKFSAFWTALSKEFASSDPNFVLFEVLNEPHDFKPEHTPWYVLQEVLIATIRANAPNHWIIATGDEWGSIDGLLKLHPSEALKADPRIIYSFHFYDPHTFTHQGASWGSPNWKNLKSIPYPAVPESIQAAKSSGMNEQGLQELTWYAQQSWDQAKIDARIEKAYQWATKHNVTVYCGEFGAYAKECPHEDRLRWLTDVTNSLRKREIGYAMWDYAGGFALSQDHPPNRTLDRQIAEAIGLLKQKSPESSSP